MFEEFSLALGGDFESAESVCNVWSGPNCVGLVILLIGRYVTIGRGPRAGRL